MDRVVIVGVLFFGVASPTTYDPRYYGRPGVPAPYPHLPDTYSYGGAGGPCEIDWLEMTNCLIVITCTNATYVELNHLRTTLSSPKWMCVMSNSKERNDKMYYEVKHNVNLKLIGTLPIDLNFNDKDNGLLQQIKYISLKDNPTSLLPEELSKLTALEVIEINNYNISIFNITKFMEFKELTNLNMSYNLIKNIEFNNHINNSADFTKLKILDLSHNLIQTLESFRNLEFSQLNYLDLSYNMIKHIDVFSFHDLMNLQNLYLSHNNILEVGNSLEDLNNIEKLTLDHNQITAIEAINFAGLNRLEILNLSTNAIKVIDDQAFDSLVKLKELDLSNNLITTITKQHFRNNFKIYSLSLKNNKIESIEFEAFKDKNFTKFDIDHNSLSGSINRIFQAANVENLDLSGMLITSIGPLAFNNAVRNLNLSHNYINSIDPLAFSESEFVNILDLSHNRLHKLNLIFSSMRGLSSLYLQNNDIEVLSQITLKNLTSLTELNLSQNKHISIESKSFIDLANLEKILLNNNQYMRNFENGTFDGLVHLSHLDFANSGITMLQNELFTDLKQLEFLNASNCQIEKIEFNAFKNLDWIEMIDLSHNSLSDFLVNNEDIVQVTTLYLSFNKINSISDNTFKGLERLFLLDLSNNNIVKIGDAAFSSLKHLEILNLGSNTDLEIKSSTLSNLSLKSLILRNITKIFNFEHTINTKVSLLDLSSCEIDDIDSIYIYKLNVEDLRLNSNRIKKLDKHSFSNLTSLQFFDASSNAISYIQPGTFLQLVNLEILNLHDNDIDKLELGAFEGLKNLQTLNLSNNEITSFKALNVRNLPALKTISLDNNKIDDISLMQYTGTKITKITIGGNKFPCSQLTNYDKFYSERYYHIEITAEVLNYHSENVDGITCTQNSEKANGPTDNSVNATFTLANAIAKLQETINNTITVINGRDVSSSGTNISSINNTLQKPIIEHIDDIFEKQYNKLGNDLNSINNSNDHSDVKSLVNITVACLVFLVVICLTMYVPKLIKNVNSLPRFRRQQSSNIPLINNRVEIE